MIPAFQKDNTLLDDIKSAKPDPEGMYVWWLGQSGFLIQYQDEYLLFDPYLSDSLTQKYATTDKPHIRMSELVIDPGRLDCIDVVTSSHNHTDHLDGETLGPLIQANPHIKLVIPEANRGFVGERLNCPLSYPMGLIADASYTIGDFTLHGIPAAHNTLAQDRDGRHMFMGFVAQFGPWTVYHSGDTLWYEGLEAYLKPFQIDLALLPINGNKPERRVAGNLNYEEAARLGKTIGAGCVIPCHYDMFTFNTEDPENFAKACEDIGQSYMILRGGERWDSSMLDHDPKGS